MNDLEALERYAEALGWLVLAVLVFVLFLGLNLLVSWVVFKVWSGTSHGYTVRYFDSTPLLLYLNLLWDSTLEIGSLVSLQVSDSVTGFFVHVQSYYKIYLVLLFLGAVGYGVSEYDNVLLDGVAVTWNDFVGLVLKYTLYPILNGLRLAIDSIVPIWDSLVRIFYFFSIKILTLGAVCAVEDVGDVVLNLAISLADLAQSVSNWIAQGPLTSVLDVTPFVARVGTTVKSAGKLLGCLCKDARKLYDLLVSPLNDPKFHSSVNNILNALLQLLVQQTGNSIKEKVRPDYSEFYERTCNGLVDFGDTLDNFLNRTYWDIADLVENNDTISSSTLPRVTCLITRPLCFGVRVANLTTSFFINIDRLDPSNANFSPAFRELNQTADCVYNFFNLTRQIFDTKAVPPLDSSLDNLGRLGKSTLKLFATALKTLLDLLIIVIVDIKDSENFFGSIQAYFEGGNMDPIFNNVRKMGEELGNIAGLFYQPASATISSVFALVANVLRVVFQFLFFVNKVFSEDAYLRSESMNNTINDAFDSAYQVTGAVGDYLRFIGTNIATIEVDDLYEEDPDGPVAAALNSTLEAVNAQTGLNFTMVVEYFGSTSDVDNCEFVNVFHVETSSPYWGQLFCCGGDLISEGLGQFVLFGRSFVLIVQNIVPPDFGAEVQGLEDLLENFDSNLGTLFQSTGCVMGFLDFEGDQTCSYGTEPNANQCPPPQPLVRSDRLANFATSTLDLLRIPLNFMINFLQVVQGQGSFDSCQGVTIASGGNNTLAQRRACVTAIANQFFLDPLFMVTNATANLGNWLNCVEPGLGDPFVTLSCVFQQMAIQLEQPFMDFILLVIDIITFLSDPSDNALQDLENIVVDAAVFLYDLLTAVLDILWTQIIVPLLKGLLDVIYDICVGVQEFVKGICFGICHPNFGCSDVYNAVGNTTNDPSGTASNNTQFWEQSPPPIPTISVGSFPSDYENQFRSKVAQPSATPTSSPSPLSPSFSPSPSPDSTADALSLINQQALRAKREQRARDYYEMLSEGVSRNGEEEKPYSVEYPVSSTRRNIAITLSPIMNKNKTFNFSSPPPSSPSSYQQGSEEGEGNEGYEGRGEERRLRYRDLEGTKMFSGRYYEPQFFNERDFPGMKWRLEDRNGKEVMNMDVSLLSAFESRVNFAGFYETAPPTFQKVLTSTKNLLYSTTEVGKEVLEKLRESNFAGSLVNFESALGNVVSRPKVQHFVRSLGRALVRDRRRNRNKEGRSIWTRGSSEAYDLSPLYRRWNDLNVASEKWLDQLLPLGNNNNNKKKGDRRAIGTEVFKILDDCLVLDQFIKTVLQQACSVQRYYSVGGMFEAQVWAFKNFTLFPDNYTGTDLPKSFKNMKCDYLNDTDRDLATVLNEEVPDFPHMTLYQTKSAVNNTKAFCKNNTSSLNCKLEDFLKDFNIDMNEVVDKVIDFLFKPSNESSVSFFFRSFFFCNFGENMECRNEKGLGVKDAFWIYYGVLTLLSLISAFLFPIPQPILPFLWTTSFLGFMLLAYVYSPFCIPAVPYCLADNIFDAVVETFPVCLEPPSCLVKNATAPPAGSSACPSYVFYNFRDDLGIVDGLDNLAIFFNWASPSAVEFFMTSKWTYFLYHIDFVKEHVDKYFFGGQPVPEAYVCGAFVTIFNLALPLILVSLFLVLFGGLLLVVLRVLFVYLGTIALTVVLLFSKATEQILIGYVERYDPRNIVVDY